ncbi:MAG: lipase family protein, partial [Campylobacterales bacterium]|nr:lipase family protein [Campylobacterales bacterium]
DFGSILQNSSAVLNTKTDSHNEYIVKNYNQKTAIMMADIADGVFWDDYGKRSFTYNGFLYGGYIDVSELLVDLQFAYGSRGDIKNKSIDIMISIRGSKEKMDWVTDINYIPASYDPTIDANITVHSGFLQSANLLKQKEGDVKIQGISLDKIIELNIEDKRDDNFFITGHSLGGAVATLYSTKLLDRGIDKDRLIVYTFGAPPISMDEGDTKEGISTASIDGKLGALASVASSTLQGHSATKNYYIDRYFDKIEIFRVYDYNDMVPKLISPARHLGIPVMYGKELSKKDLLDTDKLWKIHWMQNYKDLIQNSKPLDPKTKKRWTIGYDQLDFLQNMQEVFKKSFS